MAKRPPMVFIDQAVLKRAWKFSRSADAEQLLSLIYMEVDAALQMLGHAKDTAGALRGMVDDGEVDDEDLAGLAMYLEDDIDEIENGVVYDLYKQIGEVL